MTSGTLAEGGPFARTAGHALDIAHSELPALLRPGAELSVLDISEYVGEKTGGVRTYLTEKAHYVAARPQYRQVLLVSGREDRIIDQEGVRCYHLRGPAIPFNPAYRFLLATRSTSRIVAHERPDVIEVGSAYFAPWLIFRARRRHAAPVAWFYHAHLPRLAAPRGAEEPMSRRWLGQAASEYTRRIAALVTCTIVASDFARRELEAIGVGNLEHVPLGVDVEMFTPARRAAREGTRARLGLGQGPLVVYAGRLSREKESDWLWRAWPAVWRRTGVRLVMAGAGPLRAAFAASSGSGGRLLLEYTRNRVDLADLLAAADAYVASGPLETFGLSALEALASGTPLLSVNHGAVVEHVERSGAGVLYALRDADSLAAGLDRLLRMDGLAERARAHADRHAWPAVLDHLFGLYGRLRR
jgi:alpha-1,6-mannosyltransferase